MIDFLTEVYEDDWKQTLPYNVTNTYSSSEMAIITDKAHRDFDVPSGPDRPYISPKFDPIAIKAPFEVRLAWDQRRVGGAGGNAVSGLGKGGRA